MEKIDARKLGYEGRDTLRKMVLRLRKQSGLSGVELAKVAGVHVRTVQAWLRKVQTAGEGSLTERLRGRPPGACRKLSMVQEVWIRQRIVGAVPAQMSLPFALWTRRAIQALVAAQFGIEVSDRLIGKYLKRWGYTAQRPVKRAMEQRPALIQTWLREKYPAIATRAKAEGADRASVGMEVRDSKGTVYPVSYTMVQLDGQWKLRNVIINGINVGKLFRDQFAVATVLFCVSGLGIIGSMREGLTGECSLLLIKGVLDLFTAMLISASIGSVVGVLAVPQCAIQFALLFGATMLMPYTTPTMFADFSACGGIIMLGAGLRQSSLLEVPILSMLPGMLLVMPISALWTRFMG